MRGADDGVQGLGKFKEYTISTNVIYPSKHLLKAFGGALGFAAAGLVGHDIIVDQIGYRGIETFLTGSESGALESESPMTSAM